MKERRRPLQSSQCPLDVAQVHIDDPQVGQGISFATAILYLACTAKSNAAYVAYGEAREFVARDGTRPVPLHIRNAPTPLMKNLAYGRDYRYAHDEEGAYAAGENYFPEGMPAVQWYRPTERGLEASIKERLHELRRLDESSDNKRK